MKWNYFLALLCCFTLAAEAQSWRSNYNYVDSFSEGVAIAKKNYKHALVDSNGKEIIPLQYDEMVRIDRTFFKVKKNGSYGLFDYKGKLLIEVSYEDVGAFHDGLAKVKRYGKYGMINQSKYTIVPFQYDYIDDLSDGLILFKKNQKYGYLGKDGKEIIPAVYDRATSFHSRRATVTVNNREFVIEKRW